MIKTIKTPEDVKTIVDQIRGMVGDPEMAHSREDDLWETVLRLISKKNPINAGLLAKEALKTKDISFPRWCA